MTREVTITVSEEVFLGLQSAAGSRTISEVLEDLARRVVAHQGDKHDAEYLEMSLDADREREADEWSEGLIDNPLRGSWAERRPSASASSVFGSAVN